MHLSDKVSIENGIIRIRLPFQDSRGHLLFGDANNRMEA
jgi:hypothetical protein